MNNWNAFKALSRKELLRLKDVWTQAFLPPVITMTLYFIIFGKFIGSQLSDINGFSYMEFIVPGLIMMPLITASFMHVVFGVYISRFQRTIEDLIVSPVNPITMIIGFVMGGLARGFFVGIGVFIVSLFFIDLKIHSFTILIIFAILTSLAFSLAGLMNGLFARNFDDTSIVPTFVLTPLTYLGGVFYSITFLPEFWQKVSLFNPILYMVNGFRYGFLGISDVSISYGIAILTVFIVVMFVIDYYMIRKGIGLKT